VDTHAREAAAAVRVAGRGGLLLRRPAVDHRSVRAWLAGFIVLALAAAVLGTPNPASAAPPVEFEKLLVADGLSAPTAFRIASDGRIFIAEQGGAVRLYDHGVLHAEPMITLPTMNSDERGLLGMELDPDFENNGYIYLAYTHAENLNRLSRFTVTGHIIDPASEVVLLKSDQQANVFHHGGEVRFGPDGKLYWGLGINTYNPNAQSLGTIHGKLLRINPDGSVPEDNPFVATPGAKPHIWAWGLRNPFRFDIIPNGPNAGKPIVADVGGALYEEINVIEKGANYGWPTAEGFCSGCGFANPVYTYEHTPPPASAGSVSAITVYDGGLFPAAFTNAVFFGDYTLGFIKYLIMDEAFSSVIAVHDFDLNAGTPVQLSVGPDGALYQLNIFPGQLFRIAPSGGNRAPVAQASATPDNGLKPLPVQFSSAGSHDPDGDDIDYLWDFGDGSTSTEPNPTHEFTDDGVYNVTLTVSDGDKSSSTVVSVHVGNRRPVATITTPVNESKYDAGDTISFGGTATDPEDGALPASAFSWSVVFHHADHVHPFLGPITGISEGSFVIPRVSDNIDTTWYRVHLTVTDSGGLSHSTFVDIKPNLVTLTFQSDPPGLVFTVDGIPYTGTHTEQAVVGVERVVSAPPSQFLGGNQYFFQGWSDGGAQTHVITTPATPTVYTVTYQELNEPPAPWQSVDVGARTIAGRSAYDDGVFTIDGGGNDVWLDTDEFRYVHQPLHGDGSIVARLVSQTPTSEWAKAGVMVKSSATEGAPYALIAVTPDHGVHFQANFTEDDGEFATSLPVWLKLTRTGDLVVAAISPDGQSWSEIGSATVEMPDEATIGLFVTSHDNTQLSQVVFDNVTVNAGQDTDPGLPAPWANEDIGGPAVSGLATELDGTFLVSGGGGDIWETTDEFHFVHQTLDGDGTIVARLVSQSNTDEWAKAGLMVKAGVNAGDTYAAVFATPEHGIRMQADFTLDIGGSASSPPRWLKLTRIGSLISGYESEDGVTWTLVGTVSLDELPTIVQIGLFVTSHEVTAASTAVFDNVSVTADGGGSGGLPSPWISHDVGDPALAGSASEDGGTFTVHGAGGDIWGTADEFHFVHQSLTGDGALMARLVSQTPTNEWAKAGLMVKAGAAEGATYAAIFGTPEHGVRLQAKFDTDIAGSATTPPRWLKITRIGSMVSGYESADGANWTLVGSVALDLPETVEIGLFVTSHEVTALGTAVFDQVSFAPVSSLPAGWTSVDVGDPALLGSASVSGTTWTVNGAGNDIWADADQFHYVYRSLPGDGEIVARVLSQQATNEWAKAGVMIKQAPTAGSPYVAAFVTPAHGVHLQQDFTRDVDGGAGAGRTWLKLTRTGTTVTAYRSADGVTWTAIGTAEVAEGDLTIGLFVTSHDGGLVCTVTFDQVSVTTE